MYKRYIRIIYEALPALFVTVCREPSVFRGGWRFQKTLFAGQGTIDRIENLLKARCSRVEPETETGGGKREQIKSSLVGRGRVRGEEGVWLFHRQIKDTRGAEF